MCGLSVGLLQSHEKVDCVTSCTEPPANGSQRSIWAALTSVLSGAAGSVLVNVWSNDYRYKAFLALLLAVMVAAAARWLRQLPIRAPIVRYSRTGLLCAALVCAVATAVGPTYWVVPAAVTGGCLVG